jgi:hypothetical protein
LQKLFDTLRSKDLSLLESDDVKWMFDGKLRILDGKPTDGDFILFNSVPRSGNTFMRRYLELITGIATGGTLPTNWVWLCQGMIGEGIND